MKPSEYDTDFTHVSNIVTTAAIVMHTFTTSFEVDFLYNNDQKLLNKYWLHLNPISAMCFHLVVSVRFGANQQPGEQISEVKKRVLGEEETPEPRKPRRKRPAGPNPLSCKKKKTKPKAIAKPKPEKANRRSRKRVKIPQHVKDHMKATIVTNQNAAKWVFEKLSLFLLLLLQAQVDYIFVMIKI